MSLWLQRLVMAGIAASSLLVYGGWIAGFLPERAIAVPPAAQARYAQALAVYTGQAGAAADPARALALLKNAAAQGSPDAQFALGSVVYGGQAEGTTREAYVWFSLAAQAHYPKAAALRYESGAFLSPADIREARREVDAIRAGLAASAQ